MVFLKISQNSQENRVSFLIKPFFEKETLTQVFSCDFCEIFKSIFLTEDLRATVYYDPTKPVQLAYDASLSGSAAALLYIIPETIGQPSGHTSKAIANFINKLKKLFLKSSYILMVISSHNANIF